MDSHNSESFLQSNITTFCPRARSTAHSDKTTGAIAMQVICFREGAV
jgi:hypothetical protein